VLHCLLVISIVEFMKPALEKFFQQLDAQQSDDGVQIPVRIETHRLCEALFLFLFPKLSDEPRPAKVQYATLRHDLHKLLYPVLTDTNGAVMHISDGFFDQLPKVYDTILEDAEAILRFDPAATCIEEVIATYPGFQAIANYRIANTLHLLGAPLLPRMFAEYRHRYSPGGYYRALFLYRPWYRSGDRRNQRHRRQCKNLSGRYPGRFTSRQIAGQCETASNH